MGTRRRDVLGYVVVFAVALGARASLLLTSPGGLRGNLGDDAAVYYAGADALLHGRLPYRDFTLLHPPLLILLLVPFAALGLALGDHVGLEVASLSTEVAGAACAVLVVLVCRRLGMRRRAAAAGGLCYALWYGAVLTDMVIRLETVGSLLLALALLALASRGRACAALAGAALGAATATKIWGVVLALVVVAWTAVVDRDRRRALEVAAGAAGAFALVVVPFFAAAPAATWRMVVLDQLGRPRNHPDRFVQMATIAEAGLRVGGRQQELWALVVFAVVVAISLLAWRVRAARLSVTLLWAGVAVLVLAPSYFNHYLGLVAVPLAVTLGAGAHAATHLRPALRRAGTGLVAGGVLAAAAGSVYALTIPAGAGPTRFPTAQVARLIRHTHCPMPDGPMALILTDQLSRTLGQGCPDWVDVTGRIYDIDRDPLRLPVARDPRWQHVLTRYLFSGDVIISFRSGLDEGPALRRRLDGLPVLLRRDGVTVRLVRASR